jgi:predicted ATP-grasp superfamily ATP-dependent carboligase
MKQNILVFPCGSEVALEIFRSLEGSIHFELLGASSVDDHGRVVFERYIGGLPFVTDQHFIAALRKIVLLHRIDAIYPAMDSVIAILKRNEEALGCKVIASDPETTEICLSKSKTYKILKGAIPVPEVYTDTSGIDQFPVFAKPDIGYGSRGVKKLENEQDTVAHLMANPDAILLEYLPGKEFTVDCFTDAGGNLLFVGPRERSRIANGISVHTSTMPVKKEFWDYAEAIQSRINMNGAWFFQVKERSDGTLVLMEVASRMAGSSGVYRAKGVNFASLSLFNAFGVPVSILVNDYEVEMDRALDSRYKSNIQFQHVYIDFDDTVVVDGKVNLKLISAIHHFINTGKVIHLITKHEKNITETLTQFRILALFDEIIQLEKGQEKWRYITLGPAVFIDDSFSERKSVLKHCKIPVFSPDMVDMLLG